jgi:hypothetical protein
LSLVSVESQYDLSSLPADVRNARIKNVKSQTKAVIENKKNIISPFERQFISGIHQQQ